MKKKAMATSTERERLERLLRGQQQILGEVHQWLAEEQKHDDILRAVILSSRRHRAIPDQGLDPERIFTADTIRAMCIKYRLRFLNAGLFKGTIPSHALYQVRLLEQHVNVPVTSFKIMAPAERFRLCDSEVDPLLFVPVGEDRWYLVHKWGSDLSPWRIALGWPSRTPLHLAITVFLCALAVTMSVPGALLDQWGVNRTLFLIWNTMVFCSFTVFGWFAFFGQFSSHCWNSRYFNG
jgi:hypothetical protein